MSSISPNFSPHSFNAQSALEAATPSNANAIRQDLSEDTFTAASSSSRSSLLTKSLDWVQTVVLPMLHLSPVKQRWVAWINAGDISREEQKQRQTLAAKLKGRIEFSGEHIIIQGKLECVGLTSLPEGLKIKDGLSIENCPGLTSLPLSILQMPPRSDGRRREINLENTGITQETRSRIEAWLEERPNLRVQLYWSQAWADDLDGFATFRKALDY